MVRHVTAVPPKIPAKGMEAMQCCERSGQFLTAVEPQKSDTLRTHQQAAAIPQQIVEKSDLDSISALRQNNLVPHEGGLVFCTCAPKGGERNVHVRERQERACMRAMRLKGP